MEKETNMEKIYTTKQVADHLGLSTESVRAMLRKGRIKGAKVSQDWMVRESDLQDFMASQKSFNSHKKGKNEPVAECDKTGDTVERYKSQGIFSNIKVCDVLNFVKENTTNHDDFPYRIEITDNVDFHKTSDGRYFSKDNKLILHDINLDELEQYIPNSFMTREVQDFSIGLDEKSIIMSLAD